MRRDYQPPPPPTSTHPTLSLEEECDKPMFLEGDSGWAELGLFTDGSPDTQNWAFMAAWEEGKSAVKGLLAPKEL
jgi:hypothetical protein